MSTPSDPAACPFVIDRPVMTQRWERLTFLHWSFDPQQVQRLLPTGLTAETSGGAAWVGLVPFFMHVGTGGGRQVPWASTFPETNVRTYVRDAQGRSGIWFFSLDAARLGAVVVARSTYRLPYFWADMDVTEKGDGAAITYASRRRSGTGQPTGVASRVGIDIGAPYAADELTELDHFLTARWVLFSVAGRSRPRHARAAHLPWPLHRATVRTLDDQLVAAAGLPQPDEDPMVHYSPGVDVRIGAPRRTDQA